MTTPITLDVFLAALPLLGFTKNGSLLSKTIGSASLSVDTAKQQIIYPEGQGLTINERQTCNFSALENFVVFECVHRLLEKGYLPRHIELEPKWKLGHGSSGGRADILIRDNLDKPLLIIECKTAGREFDRAWTATLRDGAQLFSYAQQISETQFLCLYASFIEGDGTLGYINHIIAHRDNEKYLIANPTFRGFKDATDVKDRYAIWRDTYKLDYTPGGIFEPAIQPYHIGKDKYSLNDLQPISASDQQKQYHRFATILRQHNVSGRENAFDKLVNLFLCKLVDETENPDDLKFYWKGVAYDTHFELLDRLQQLYQRGMGKFLGEDITYINEGDVSNALRFIRQNPDATHRAVWNLFIQQKFFTNNDFSFIDVHNEKLFYQNAEVLLKILQSWQDIRLVDETRHNQFLGDMFEGFLDQGVKQSEGQFFTPMPICRFLIQSLPLVTLVKDHPAAPKAIDYACGAGHFLTELALQLKPLIEKHHPQRDIADYHRAIHGIEKEYRLSKIAKVSAFMYQQPGIQICYADALIHDHTTYPEIQNGTFDLLVANPPFSVKGFLETLPEDQQSLYSLTGTIKDADTANSIETFFLERAAQLLKPGGLAAIILPASILSNGGTTYTRAREILLQHFDVAAIAEFGSGTFGKTGTNTVTLFLRRKAVHPDSAAHYRERIEEWFKGEHNSKRKQVIYKDAHLIDAYAAHIGIPAEDYKTLLCGQPSDVLLAHETFAACVKEWENSTEIAKLKKQKKFKALAKDQQISELHKRRLTHLATIEQDKLLYFILAREQSHPVLILKSPSDIKERKAFLGYDWSSAKGDEGIKLIKDAAGRHLTPLYDEADRDNPEKINHAIVRNFLGELKEIPVALQPWLTLSSLPDLLGFIRTSFEKQISLTAKKTVTIQSRWPVVKLGDASEINPSKRAIAQLAPGTLVSFVEMAAVSNHGFIETPVDRPIDELRKGSFTYFADGDIIIAKITPCMENGKCALARELASGIGMGSSEFHVIRTDSTKLLPEYAFSYINRDSVKRIAESNMTGSSGHRRVPADFYSNLPLPLPPLDIQRKIVAECEAVDKEAEKALATIEKARQAIAQELGSIQGAMTSLSGLTFKIGSGATPFGGESSYKSSGISLIRSQNVHDEGFREKGLAYIDEQQANALSNVIVEENDVLLNITGASVARCCLADSHYLPARVNQHVAIIRPDTAKIAPKFLQMILVSQQIKTTLLQLAGNSATREALTKQQLQDLKIPVPPLKTQQKFIQTVEFHEAKIAAAETLLAAAPARKAEILNRHLQ